MCENECDHQLHKDGLYDEKYAYTALVKSVYDGDTITCNVQVGFSVMICDAKIRLFGIDTPELRGSEREDGIKSRDYLRNLILGKEITLYTIKDKKGKYGRYLGLIVINDIKINDLLVKDGFGEYANY